MIGFDLKVNKQKVEQQLLDLIKSSVPASKLEVSGFEVLLTIISAPVIVIKDKVITTKLPLSVSFTKNAALFTVQGHGQLNAEVLTQYDVNPNFILTTKSSIQDHTWIEKPVIDFGSLDITIEKLIDLILRHYNDLIAASIDKSIKDALDLNGIVKSAITQMRSKLQSFNFKGISLYVEPTELLLEPIDTDAQFFKAKGSVRAEIACASKNTLQDNGCLLRWVESLLSDNISYVRFDVTEHIISDLLCDFVNKQEYGGELLVSDKCTVDFKPNNVIIQLHLVKPITSVVLLTGKPRYNEHESKLYIDDLDVQLKASNFIYKLTAPLVNKFLESNIKENLPVDVDALIKTHLANYYKGNTSFDGMQISHSISSVNLTEMQFNDEGVSALLKVNDGELSIGL
jgi:Domain of unknown function (DUF4403)